MLLIKTKSVMLIATMNAIGLFTGSGNVNPFSVDLPVFCRSFRVESNTTRKIYVGHDVFLINTVHNAIDETVFLKI